MATTSFAPTASGSGPATATLPPILVARHGDLATVTDLIADAFTTSPVASWLVPDEPERPAVVRNVAASVVEHALDHGTVHVFDDRSGAAVWRTCPASYTPHHERRWAAACGDYADRFETVDRLIDDSGPMRLHHNLVFLAVRRDAQRTGRGTALLRHHHDRLDQQGTPAYVAAASAGASALFARHGYERRPAFMVRGGPVFWPMVRPSGRTAPA